MGIKYRPDEDLAFLQFCDEDDVRALACYLTHDAKGRPRLTSELLENKAFVALIGDAEQHRRNWRLVAGELQHFGGDTLANVFRGAGVLYNELLTDVCTTLKVQFDETACVYEIENRLLDKLLSDAWKKMSREQMQSLLSDVGLDHLFDPTGGLSALQVGLRAGGMVSLQISVLVASINVQMLDGHAFGLAQKRLFGLPLISGPAYRVTIPSVIQIAYMRRAYELRDYPRRRPELAPQRSSTDLAPLLLETV